MTTAHVTSKDGSTIAVDTVGQGPAVILVGGAFNDRSTVAATAAALAPHFTAVTYDRRGRVESTDKAVEAGLGFRVQNEIDDVAAVIEHVGGHAALFGHSSGAILCLEAALHGLPVDAVAGYEPPYRADPDLPHSGRDFLDRITAFAENGDREGAASLFLSEAMGVPPEGLEGMKQGPGWDFLLDKALTLPYDVTLSQPWELADRERLATLSLPVLAVYGDRTFPMLRAGTEMVAEAVPGARLVVLPGEDHGVLAHPEALEPSLREFFGG
ncbi:alpha/beta hydrolase [Catenulispora yoronensis]|uniref:Alpha/beta hydrolase n=1 Tax=Catenulispora yoronensis TaxID=450799 RepID=A0ABP5FXQ4_9ACTN